MVTEDPQDHPEEMESVAWWALKDLRERKAQLEFRERGVRRGTEDSLGCMDSLDLLVNLEMMELKGLLDQLDLGALLVSRGPQGKRGTWDRLDPWVLLELEEHLEI